MSTMTCAAARTAHQVRRIKEFVDAHISKQIAITELANLVGLSQFHFIRAFKRSVGLSPYQYVLSERISVAKELLPKRDLSIAAVALMVGFKRCIPIEPRVSKVDGNYANGFSSRERLRLTLFSQHTHTLTLTPAQRECPPGVKRTSKFHNNGSAKLIKRRQNW
jgi:methylphosphotriester-DNA--protein-cysteine methyltransferase